MKASQIALGTANFGLQYGVKNQRQLSPKEVKQILDACSASGIATVDTAIGYGESQRVLGRAGSQNFDCITKLPGLSAKVENVQEWVHSQVAQALLDLRQEKLYGLLLHKPQDLLGPHGPELAKAMRTVQEEFNIQRLGVSVYEPQELLDCWEVLRYDLVQLPCNVFDQRFTTGPALDHLSSRNIEVHARSVFLQGLLLMPESNRPTYFDPWTHVFDSWKALVAISESTPLEMCIAFADQQRFVHKWVIGVDNKKQIMQILRTQDTHDLKLPKLWADFAALPHDLILPLNWNRNNLHRTK